MRRIAGIVLAVLLIGGVVAAVVAGRNGQDKGTATKTVQGVIGSEKAEFYAAPENCCHLAEQECAFASMSERRCRGGGIRTGCRATGTEVCPSNV
ncbi:hypothetical protein [Streptomyces sp. NPDC050564]|uniref:hypothetical protein n=1 Tax=Streptomyces sp. NPDC050564 TaxID=3365631 RepID=UPI0037B1E185